MDRRPDIVAAVGRMTSPDEVRREIQHLPEYLRSGESVQRLAAGVYGVGTGLLAVTDSRVVVLREGRAGQASEGFPFEQLSGLDWATTTPEHATITIRDTTRTTEFTQVAPTDAAELVGFVRTLLRAQAAPPVEAPPAPVSPAVVSPAVVPPAVVPPVVGAAPAAPAVAPPVAPSRGTPAGGSIGHKFDVPPAVVSPGAGAPAEPVPPGGVAGAGYEAGAPAAAVESTAGVRGERWPLREVPVSQLIGTPPEAADRAAGAPSAGASTAGEPEGRAVGEPVEPPPTAAAPDTAAPPDAPDAPDVPNGSDAAAAPEEAQDPAASEGAAAKAARRPRFWRRSRAREVGRTPPAGA